MQLQCTAHVGVIAFRLSACVYQQAACIQQVFPVTWCPLFCLAGTGFAVLHCHILPHEDEGCMMKTQLLEKVWAPDALPSGAHSQGGKAGLAIMVLVLTIALIGLPVVLYKKKKAKKAAEQDALMNAQYEPARTQSATV